MTRSISAVVVVVLVDVVVELERRRKEGAGEKKFRVSLCFVLRRQRLVAGWRIAV